MTKSKIYGQYEVKSQVISERHIDGITRINYTVIYYSANWEETIGEFSLEYNDESLQRAFDICKEIINKHKSGEAPLTIDAFAEFDDFI